VHLVTTSEGAQDARIALLAPETDWFHRLCGDYNLNGIVFGAGQIHVIRGAGGRPVEDIRTKAEHEACAGLITEKVRAFTADQGAALHVSLAAGRKTMTYNFFHQRMARIRKRLEEATRCSGYFCAAPKGGPDRGSGAG
jgi:CRISPR-associated protein (TIGR02584 family)